METVRLSKAYQMHGKSFDAVVLRPPTLADRMDIGPIELDQYANGTVIRMELTENLNDYIKRLVQPPVTIDVLDILSLQDAEALIGAVRGFFYPAALLTEANNKPTSSSSSSDGMRDGSVH
ncbi:MAG: hypothetical protein AAF903_12275 [Pseudomonadota bacterium]